MNRRTVIVGLGLVVGGAGCQGSPSEPAARPCRVTRSRLSGEPVTPTAEQRKRLVPVILAEQTGATRDVFADVADGESVTGTCPRGEITDERTQALTDALATVRKRIGRQRDRYDRPGEAPAWIARTADLRRGESWFGLNARLSDVGISSVTDLPQRSATASSTSS